jgi:transcriptional regulator with XRE-family HTH domain
MAERTKFGDRLRRRRRDLNLSQNDLAALTGLSQVHISHIEVGRNVRVPSDKLFVLARHLDVSADWLIGLTDNEPAREAV